MTYSKAKRTAHADAVWEQRYLNQKAHSLFVAAQLAAEVGGPLRFDWPLTPTESWKRSADETLRRFGLPLRYEMPMEANQ